MNWLQMQWTNELRKKSDLNEISFIIHRMYLMIKIYDNFEMNDGLDTHKHKTI